MYVGEGEGVVYKLVFVFWLNSSRGETTLRVSWGRGGRRAGVGWIGSRNLCLVPRGWRLDKERLFCGLFSSSSKKHDFVVEDRRLQSPGRGTAAETGCSSGKREWGKAAVVEIEHNHESSQGVGSGRNRKRRVSVASFFFR